MVSPLSSSPSPLVTAQPQIDSGGTTYFYSVDHQVSSNCALPYPLLRPCSSLETRATVFCFLPLQPSYLADYTVCAQPPSSIAHASYFMADELRQVPPHTSSPALSSLLHFLPPSSPPSPLYSLSASPPSPLSCLSSSPLYSLSSLFPLLSSPLQELLQRSALCLTQPSANTGPSEVDSYHSLCPLEPVASDKVSSLLSSCC